MGRRGDALVRQHKPRRPYCHKPARREVEVMPEYVGFTVPDRWVVGYGLDSDGLYRNLPYVSFVE